MKTDEIRTLSAEAVLEQAHNAKDELMRLRFQQATGELTDYSRLRITRRKIARLYTILKEQQAASGGEGEQGSPEPSTEGEQ